MLNVSSMKWIFFIQSLSWLMIFSMFSSADSPHITGVEPSGEVQAPVGGTAEITCHAQVFCHIWQVTYKLSLVCFICNLSHCWDHMPHLGILSYVICVACNMSQFICNLSHIIWHFWDHMFRPGNCHMYFVTSQMSCFTCIDWSVSERRWLQWSPWAWSILQKALCWCAVK